jgi:hypothetical protein
LLNLKDKGMVKDVVIKLEGYQHKGRHRRVELKRAQKLPFKNHSKVI